MEGLPIIRLEIEGMKQTIVHAFTALQLETDSYVKQALEKFCKPENLERIIEQSVNREIEAAIKGEVERFFQYGKGRDVIAEAVKKKLERKYV